MRAVIRWKNVAQKIWKDTGGNQEDILPLIEDFKGYKTEVKERIERRQILALRNKVQDDEHLRDIRVINRRDKSENVFARPNGLRENDEITISGTGPGPARKKKEV